MNIAAGGMCMSVAGGDNPRHAHRFSTGFRGFEPGESRFCFWWHVHANVHSVCLNRGCHKGRVCYDFSQMMYMPRVLFFTVVALAAAFSTNAKATVGGE